ncbi:MAG TPA: TIGR03009 domain-containing protein [Gemmataceae bacterium]|nr:TIGR03009 domain-containing protein [Gemmataceae bacterium]
MRLLGYTFAALLLNSAVLWAQQQPPSAPPINIPPKPGTPAEPANLLPKLDPQNNRLDKLLLDWEKRMTGVDSIACKCAREEKSKASGFKKVYEGEARYLKPNMVALRMIMPSDKTIWELYVFTGKHLWEYRPQTKTLRIHEMAPEQTNFQNNFLSFLFGMNAADAKRRYELSLTKEDQHYIYIDVKPRFDADKREFSRAQMVLFTKNMLPARLFFEMPNGDETTWNITDIDTTVKLKESHFLPPPAPEGWRKEFIPLPQNNPPPPAPNSPQPSKVRP